MQDPSDFKMPSIPNQSSRSDSGMFDNGFLFLNAGIKYHLYRKETDMRRSFDSLCGIVKNELGGSVCAGNAYIFINKHHTHLKLLVKDQGGFRIFYLRRDEGTFPIPAFNLDAKSVQLVTSQLLSLLNGKGTKH